MASWFCPVWLDSCNSADDVAGTCLRTKRPPDLLAKGDVLPGTLANHTATLLVSGRVWITGGTVAGTPSVAAQVVEWDEGLGHSTAWAPAITAINNPTSFPVTTSSFATGFGVVGLRLNGVSEAASGRAGASSRAAVVTAYGPLGGSGAESLRVSASDNVLADRTRLAASFPGLVRGYYLIRASANGMPGPGRIIVKE